MPENLSSRLMLHLLSLYEWGSSRWVKFVATWSMWSDYENPTYGARSTHKNPTYGARTLELWRTQIPPMAHA